MKKSVTGNCHVCFNPVIMLRNHKGIYRPSKKGERIV